MKTYYTIIKVPIEIEFECPYCNWNQIIDWNDVESDDGEFGKWTGNIHSIECENCGKEVEFDECEVE